MLDIKRVYEPQAEADGTRILVERLWPRGIRKAALRLDGWNKDVAPSTGLRKWFGHEPAKWGEFQKRYFAELERNPQAWEPLVREARRGPLTLLYSSHDSEHNNAVALAAFLLRHGARRRSRPKVKPLARPRARRDEAAPAQH
jgi:uncharacterized protein YeaO (DUF488 family)